MAFPEIINPLSPADGSFANLGPAEIRALEQFLVDVFGLPTSPTAINAAAFGIDTNGFVTLPAGTPTTALGAATKAYVDAQIANFLNSTIQSYVLQPQGVSNALVNTTVPAGSSRTAMQIQWNAPVGGNKWTPLLTFTLNFTASTNAVAVLTAAISDSTGNLFNPALCGATSQSPNTIDGNSVYATFIGGTSVAAGTAVTFTVTATAQSNGVNLIGFPTPVASAASCIKVNWIPTL